MPPVLIIYLMSSLEKVKASLKTAALNDPRAFLRPAQQEKGEGSRVRPSVHCCKWQLIWESRTQQHSGISPYQPPCTGVPESDLPAGQRGPREHPPPPPQLQLSAGVTSEDCSHALHRDYRAHLQLYLKWLHWRTIPTLGHLQVIQMVQPAFRRFQS